MKKTIQLGIKQVGSASALTLNKKSKPGDGSVACGRKGGVGPICL